MKKANDNRKKAIIISKTNKNPRIPICINVTVIYVFKFMCI